MPANADIRVRVGTAALWTSTNPILGLGEPGHESDTGKVKFGDGVTVWAALTYIGAAAGGGVSDHGLLTGLPDDDHPQYHNDARGDARYAALSHLHDYHTSVVLRDEGTDLGTDGTANVIDFVGAGVLASRVGSVVTVTIPGGGAGGGVTDHGMLSGLANDGHPQYHTDARGDARYLRPAAIGVTVQGYTVILQGTTAAFTTALDVKLGGIGAGATANATDAQLRDRATHTGTQAVSTITGLGSAATTPTTNYATAAQGALAGTAVQPARSIGTTAPLTGGGDLSTNRTLGISAATTIAAGSMSAADKVKLDGVSAGASVFSSILDFGGVGNDTFNNTTAFTNAEASAFDRIYLPEGTFKLLSVFNFTKYYYGPGRIRTSDGGFMPGRTTQITTRPTTGTGLDYDRYFSADLGQIEAEVWSLGGWGNNIRKGLNEQYFESATTPHFQWFTNHSGWSGTSALLTVAAAIGATTITLPNTTGYDIGMVIGMSGGSADPSFMTLTDTITITSKTATTLTFTPALASSYPGTGFARGRITHGMRTMNPMYHQVFNHIGGGDAYGIVCRGIAGYPALATQEHYFFTSTIGIVGGDLSASAPHNFLTGIEIDHRDNGHQTACSGLILNFQRTNALETRGEVWRGILLKSEGGTPLNAFESWAGKSKVGLDTVQADFGTAQCAIGLGVNHRIYFDNSATPDASGLYTQVGNVMGFTYQYFDGTALRVFVNGGLSLTMHNTYVQSPVSIGTDEDLYVAANKKVKLEGNGGDTHLTYVSASSQIDVVVNNISCLTAKTDDVRLKVNGAAIVQAQFISGNPKLAFYGNPPVNRPVVTGSRSTGAADVSLLAALVALGLITDTTTA